MRKYTERNRRAVKSAAVLKRLKKLFERGLAHTSKKAMKHLKDKYKKNRKLLEKNFLLETNNVQDYVPPSSLTLRI